ncbi:MAG: Nif3-like dinuclear metal center hexameric protein [Chitinophagaceae bacterium]|nr:Nif3-like dinuclear metal center hexameric protein [Chitinophagaceae bacterium]
MSIDEIIVSLETFAPVYFQEEYDNAGLLTGDAKNKCTGALISLDVTEEVIQEAIKKKCNLVIAHHPLIFKGLKKITGNNYVERTVIKAIKNDIAIYAIHTNLDNVKNGVNKKIADRLALKNISILQPKENILEKLITFAPPDKADDVRSALFAAGGGALGKYSECSFSSMGTGTFKPGEGADPYVGKIGKRHEEKEIKIEVIFPAYLQDKMVQAMITAHPYEEIAYDIISLNNYFTEIGSGMIGELEEPIEENAFLQNMKEQFNLKMIRHTDLSGRKIKKVAVCGGAGSFLIHAALQNKADAFITADIKYHDFFDVENRMLLADIGHFESEQFTIDLLYEILQQKFPNFAVRKTEVRTNPVNYYL